MEEASRRGGRERDHPSSAAFKHPCVYGQLRRDEENFTAY